MRTIEYIESVICAEEKINAPELNTKSRQRKTTDIRQMIMYFAMLFGNTEAMAGCYYGRDHATAHNAKVSMQNLIDTDRTFREKFEKYYDILKAGENKTDYIHNRIERLRKEANDLVNELQKIEI